MQITSFSYSRTAQPKQFESVKVEASGVPSEAQGAVEAFTELVSFVDTKVEEACAAANGQAKPPLADKPKAKPLDGTSCTPAGGPLPGKEDKKADPTSGVGSGRDVTSSSKAQPSPEPTPVKKSRSTSKAAKQGEQLEKEKAKRVQYAAESQSLVELHTRITELRDFGAAFTLDEWSDANKKLYDLYKKLPKDNVDIQNALVSTFKAENNIIQEWRRAGNGYAAAKQAVEPQAQAA